MVTDKKATESQKKMFFALVHDLGKDNEKAKEWAKLRFKLVSFADISNKQITEVIDILKENHRKVNKVNPIHSHRFVCECGVALVVDK